MGSVVEFGAYPNQPPFGAPPRKTLEYRNSAPRMKIQNDSAFSRGNATSRAPIISGIR